MKHRLQLIAWLGAGVCITFFLISQFAFTNEKQNGGAHNHSNRQTAVQWTVPDVPETMDFAGKSSIRKVGYERAL
ncbi:MAG: hypothetical protein JWN76_2192 [Chitinophagaceae bacterium]|nr:hypothetical protein [Chitinophagaceae bacterium]